MNHPEKDWWDKLEIVAKTIGAVVIPICVVAATIAFNYALNDREIATQRFELALEILRTSPEDGPPLLRHWAAASISDYTGLSTAEKEELIETALPSTDPISPNLLSCEAANGEQCCVTCRGETYCGSKVTMSCS